jgi:Arc/MetJ-type ribon-helix-helix transcriptional regulator
MKERTPMEISVNPDIEQLISRHVQSGEYRSPSDVIRTAVLLLHERIGPGAEQQTSQPRRSPRGILADMRSSITPADIAEVSKEMWARFPRDEA